MLMTKAYGKVIKTHIVNKLRVRNISDLCKLPGKGESVHIVTQKNITRHTFTEWVLGSGVIDAIYISTYRFSVKNISVLKKYMDDGVISSATILLAQNYKMLLKNASDEFDEIVERSDIILSLGYNHSKVTLLQSGKNYFVLTGSGNYSENDHIEEYQMYNDKELFEFHREWITNGK